MDLGEYVLSHAVRGACTCGRCADAPPSPEKCQPEGHTADVMFFKVAKKGEPDAEVFQQLVEKEHPHWLDGKEHSYLEIGADMGDQGIALVTMGLGHLLGVWQLFTPKSIMPYLPEEMQMGLAGQGMVTIKTIREE